MMLLLALLVFCHDLELVVDQDLILPSWLILQHIHDVLLGVLLTRARLPTLAVILIRVVMLASVPCYLNRIE